MSNLWFSINYIYTHRVTIVKHYWWDFLQKSLKEVIRKGHELFMRTSNFKSCHPSLSSSILKVFDDGYPALVPSSRGVTNYIYIMIYYFSAIHVHFKLQKPALPSLTYDIRCMCSLPISFDTFKGMINKETSKSSVLSYAFYFLCLGYCLHGMQAIIWYFYFVYF